MAYFYWRLESEFLDWRSSIGDPLKGVVVLAKVVVKPGPSQLPLAQVHRDVLAQAAGGHAGQRYGHKQKHFGELLCQPP